jgi:hypothetical protein
MLIIKKDDLNTHGRIIFDHLKKTWIFAWKILGKVLLSFEEKVMQYEA